MRDGGVASVRLWDRRSHTPNQTKTRTEVDGRDWAAEGMHVPAAMQECGSGPHGTVQNKRVIATASCSPQAGTQRVSDVSKTKG